MRKVSPETLTKFLEEARTLPEIGRVIQTKATARLVHDLDLLPGYAAFEQKNERGGSVFIAVKQEKVPEGRVWHLWQSKKQQPYCWIQFPPEYQHDRIQIVPLSDVHYGAKAHSHKRFLEYVEWIRKTDDVFTFLNGDLIENAIDGSIGGAVYESIMTPSEQIWGSDDGKHQGIIEILRPIAHKILFAQPGNHEHRTWKKTNIDPLRIVCRELGLPYFSEPIYADVLAWGHRFTFYAHHGVSGSATKGGKMNAAGKPAEFQENVNFVVMGHLHDSMSNQTTRIFRERKYDQNGNVSSFNIKEVSQHVILCPSFFSYFDSYASRSGYSPGSWGSVNMSLFSDGSYRAGE